MSKTKTPPVDRAEATVKKATRTDSLKVSVTRSVCQGMKQCADWAAATLVQTAVKAWSDGADGLEANAKVIVDLRTQLKAAEAKQNTLRRDWGVAKAHVLVAVTSFCGGSADKVKAFTLDVVTRGRLGALGAPIDLIVMPGKAIGEAVSTWEKGIAQHGFLVQHATDPSNAATVSAPIASTKPKFTLGGLPSGANVSVRVAAIDPASPTGQSPWSAWVVGNAR